jgi:hypothetical protein
MLEIWVLIITVYSGLIGYDSGTVHVKSFRTIQECQAEGRDIQLSVSMRVEFVCVPHYTKKI